MNTDMAYFQSSIPGYRIHTETYKILLLVTPWNIRVSWRLYLPLRQLYHPLLYPSILLRPSMTPGVSPWSTFFCGPPGKFMTGGSWSFVVAPVVLNHSEVMTIDEMDRLWFIPVLCRCPARGTTYYGVLLRGALFRLNWLAWRDLHWNGDWRCVDTAWLRWEIRCGRWSGQRQCASVSVSITSITG